MCESGGDGGGNDGGASGQAGYGGSGVGSAEADSGYGTSSSGWGAADNGNGGGNDGGGSGGDSAGPSGKGNAAAASAERGFGRSAFDDATSRRDSLENTSLTEKGLLSDPGMSVSIESVDPNSGAQSFGSPTNSTTTNRDGSVSIGLDLSSLDPDAMRGWAVNPQMAKNYSSLAREDAGLSTTLGNMVAAAQPNGFLGTLSKGFSFAPGIGPAIGLIGPAAIDANQAAGFRGAAFGLESTPGQVATDMGASLGRSVTEAVAGNVTGNISSKLGYGIAGIPGAVVGGIAGSQFGKGLLGDPGSSSPGTNNSKGFDGFGNDDPESVDVASANVGQPGNPSVNTGWNSKFGDYNSHVSGFKSYGSNSALDAFS